MNQAPVKILQLIEPAVSGVCYWFVGAEVLVQGKEAILRVYIDSVNVVLVVYCSKVSHQISGVMDVEDPISGQYTLEVSSPGLERPLYTLSHFERFKGSFVKLELSQATLEGQRRFTGDILGVKDESVLLHVDDEEIEIPFARIKKAKLAVKY